MSLLLLESIFLALLANSSWSRGRPWPIMALFCLFSADFYSEFEIFFTKSLIGLNIIGTDRTRRANQLLAISILLIVPGNDKFPYGFRKTKCSIFQVKGALVPVFSWLFFHFLFRIRYSGFGFHFVCFLNDGKWMVALSRPPIVCAISMLSQQFPPKFHTAAASPVRIWLCRNRPPKRLDRLFFWLQFVRVWDGR